MEEVLILPLCSHDEKRGVSSPRLPIPPPFSVLIPTWRGGEVEGEEEEEEEEEEEPPWEWLCCMASEEAGEEQA